MDTIIILIVIIGVLYVPMIMFSKVLDKTHEASDKLRNTVLNNGKGTYYCSKKKTWVNGK